MPPSDFRKAGAGHCGRFSNFTVRRPSKHRALGRHEEGSGETAGSSAQGRARSSLWGDDGQLCGFLKPKHAGRRRSWHSGRTPPQVPVDFLTSPRSGRNHSPAPLWPRDAPSQPGDGHSGLRLCVVGDAATREGSCYNLLWKLPQQREAGLALHTAPLHQLSLCRDRVTCRDSCEKSHMALSLSLRCHSGRRACCRPPSSLLHSEESAGWPGASTHSPLEPQCVDGRGHFLAVGCHVAECLHWVEVEINVHLGEEGCIPVIPVCC